jgi:hypothetical protein
MHGNLDSGQGVLTVLLLGDGDGGWGTGTINDTYLQRTIWETRSLENIRFANIHNFRIGTRINNYVLGTFWKNIAS